MKTLNSIVGVFGLVMLSAAVQAEVKVENAWIRLLPPMVKTTAAYMEMVSSQDDVLIGISSSIAMMSEIHESSMSDGVMSMDHVSEIKLEKDKPLFLKPGGYHIMLMNLQAPLKEGDKHKLTLEFKQAGLVEIEVPVRKD